MITLPFSKFFSGSSSILGKNALIILARYLEILTYLICLTQLFIVATFNSSQSMFSK